MNNYTNLIFDRQNTGTTMYNYIRFKEKPVLITSGLDGN